MAVFDPGFLESPAGSIEVEEHNFTLKIGHDVMIATCCRLRQLHRQRSCSVCCYNGRLLCDICFPAKYIFITAKFGKIVPAELCGFHI